MANYSLVIDSSFRPFSYDELIKPIIKATEEHKDIEEKYAELEENASIWERRANAETDPETYKLYMGYARDLEAQADALSRHGLTPFSRKSMLRMRSRFNKEIKPIEEAWNLRKELQAEQRKLRAADDTLRFDNDYNNMSLDYMLNHPNASYESLSGNKILETTAKTVGTFAKRLLNNPEYKSILNGQYYQELRRMGLSDEQILMTAANDPNAPAFLRDIKNQIHGALRSNGAYDFDFVDNWINLGLNFGRGEDVISALKNGEYIDAATRMENSIKERDLASRNAYQQGQLANERARIDLQRQLQNRPQWEINTSTGLPYAVLPDGSYYDPTSNQVYTPPMNFNYSVSAVRDNSRSNPTSPSNSGSTSSRMGDAPQTVTDPKARGALSRSGLPISDGFLNMDGDGEFTSIKNSSNKSMYDLWSVFKGYNFLLWPERNHQYTGKHGLGWATFDDNGGIARGTHKFKSFKEMKEFTGMNPSHFLNDGLVDKVKTWATTDMGVPESDIDLAFSFSGDDRPGYKDIIIPSMRAKKGYSINFANPANFYSQYWVPRWDSRKKQWFLQNTATGEQGYLASFRKNTLSGEIEPVLEGKSRIPGMGFDTPMSSNY